MIKKLVITIAVLAMAVSCFAAKNVILVVSDGTGINAINMYEQFSGKKTIMRSFPCKLFATTYSRGLSFDSAKAWKDTAKIIPNWDYLAACTDSAAAATAINSGKKTYNGHINHNGGLEHYDTIALAAKRGGYLVGDITTVSWTDTTPAGVSAHSASRGSWNQISHELLTNGVNDVIGGGGNPDYHTDGKLKQTASYNVISKGDWTDIKNGVADYKLVENREDFQALAANKGANGLFLFSPKCSGDMPVAEHVPTTAEMAVAALNILNNNNKKKDGKGFFFMLEEGRPDHANHANNGEYNVQVINALDDAVRAMCAWVNKNSNWNDTMIIVTADHETGGIFNTDGTYFLTSNGIGKMPNYKYTTGGHSNLPVPFFQKGGNTKIYDQYIRGKDPVLGKYIDNTDISKGICDFMNITMVK